MAGLMIPMQHAAAAGPVAGHSAGRLGVTTGVSSIGSVSGTSLTVHKQCFKSDSTCDYSACSKDVCLSLTIYRTYFVGPVGEIVKWTGHATKTLHTRVTFPKYTALVGSKTLTFDTGRHGWSWSLHYSQAYPGDKFCAGATNTPGYPCITVPS
jgi:hypothetical protein